MQAGSLANTDVASYTARVLVNGVVKPVDSVSFDRALSGDLPDQVSAVSGVTQATGTIAWSQGADVSDNPAVPWGPQVWMPKRGDRVEVYFGDGVREWKQFHGLIDKTTGSFGGGFQSTIIDDFDKLTATVTHAPLLRIMPPAQGGGDPNRTVGLMPLYYVDFALRQAGFHCTPPPEYLSSLMVNMQGSLWPLRGTLISTMPNNSHGNNSRAPWGISMSDFTATYNLWGNHTSAEPVQITLMAAPDHAGASYVRVFYGSGDSDFVQLTLSFDRVARAYRNNTVIAEVPMGSAVVASMLVKNGSVTIRTNEGATATGSMSIPPGDAKQAQIYASANARTAGAQVSFPTRTVDELVSTRWTPSAVMDTGSLYLNGLMDAGKTIEGVTAQELLEEIGSATLAAFWIDETGVARWAPSDSLRGHASVRTVTTLDDVLSLDWEDGLLGTASKVTVKAQKPAITRGRWQNTVLTRGGGGESMRSGDEVEIFLEPESDEDWIQPSTTFLQVGGSGGIWGSANNPEYSLTGLYYSSDGGTTEATGLNVSISTSVLGLQKILVKYVAGAWPADVEGVLSTSPTAGTLWPKNRDKPLPKLVGSGRVKWTSEEYVATGPAGAGPELVHELGQWGNRVDSQIMLERLASFIQGQTTNPEPIVTGLSIVPDPRLQLGDIITVRSNVGGFELRALIISVNASFDSELSMDLGVRVLSAKNTSVTYEEFQKLTPATYSAFRSESPSPQTYTQFKNDV